MRQTYNRLDQVVTPRPNWSTPVKEVLEYRTEIFTSEDGHEERHGYRVMPRWSVQYRADTANEAANQLFYDLVRPWADRSFAVPVRHRQTTTTGTDLTGGTSITIGGTLPWWMQVGVNLVIESSTTQQLVTVESIEPISAPGIGLVAHIIHITGTLQADVAPNDKVLFALRSHYESENELTSLIRSHRGLSATFLADPARMSVIEPPTSGYEVYRGYQIIPFRHNWSQRLQLNLDDRQEVVDTDRGVIDRVWYHQHRFITETRRYTAMSAAQAAELVQSFMRHRGMRVPFWTALSGYNLPPHGNGTTVSPTLYFPDFEFRETFEDDPVLNHLWVQWPDGAYQINRITGYGTSVGQDFVQVEDNWERAIDSTTIVRWAVLARFGTDRLELDWQTSEVAQAQLPIRALRTDWVPDNDTTDNLKWL